MAEIINQHPDDHPPQIVTGGDATFRVDAPATHAKPHAGPSLSSRLLGYKKWLVVASLAVVGVAIAGAVTLALQAGLTTKPGSQRPGSTPTPTPVQATSRDEGDNSFFAAQALSLLYYSFAQTSNTKNTFQAIPNQQESRFITIGFPEKYDHLTSDNGAYLVRWTSTTLELSSAAAPSQFMALYQVTTGGRIDSVLWHPDHQQLLLATSTAAPEGSGRLNKIELVNAKDAQLKPVTIMSSTDTKIGDGFSYALRAFRSANSFYYTENRGGLQSNLTLFDLQDKKMLRQLPQLQQNGLLAKMQFDRAMTWGYWVDGNMAKRRNLESGKEEILYQISRDCGYDRANASRVDWLTVSPSNSKLVVYAQPEACSSYGQTEDVRSRLMIIDLTTKKTIREVYQAPLPSLAMASWAPGELTVWLQIDTQSAYLLKTDTLSYDQVPSGEQQALTKERPLFLGWLVGKPE